MDLEDGDPVSKLVLNARNEIVYATESTTNSFGHFFKLCGLLPSSGNPSTVDSEKFLTIYYSEFLAFLLSNLDPTWLNVDIGGNTFENMVKHLIMDGSQEQSFIATCQSLKIVRPQSYMFQKIVTWICELMENNCVCNVLSKRCQDCHTDDILFLAGESYKEFLQLISSLPNVVLGHSKESLVTDLFYPEKYSLYISQQIIASLAFCHKRLVSNQDTSVVPISKLLGKMCLSGYGQNIWSSLTDSISEILSENLLWRRLMQKVISNVDEWCFECTINPLIIQIKSPHKMSEYLGELPLKISRLENILINKFILCQYFNDASIPKIILVYLASNSNMKTLFEKLMINVLKVWRQKALLKHQPIEQTYYVCQVILIGLNILRKMDVVPFNVKEEINKTILDGLPFYLSSSILEVQQMGMIVAQSLASLTSMTNVKLELPIEDNDFTRKFLSILDSNDFDMKQTSVTSESMEEPKNKALLDSDDDDDDDLQPLPKASKKTGPTYLAQCIEGLSNYEDPNLMEECLKTCESVIQRHSELGELDVELCKRLLSLEDRFSIDNFHDLKNNALVLLIIKSPDTIAQFLTEQFYERNYNIRQRLEILEILVKGAQKLSSSGMNNENKEIEQTMTKDFPDKDWQRVVQERIDLKTRRLGKDQSKVRPREFINRFSTCAGWFFYPLLKNFDTKEYLDMLGEDHILLEKLLNSLAHIIHCSINIPSSANMAKTLLQFCSCFRMHEEAGVRRAVLHAACMSIVILDEGNSLPEVSQELCDLQPWLNVVALRDPDSHCSQFAEQILSLLKGLRIKLLQ